MVGSIARARGWGIYWSIMAFIEIKRRCQDCEKTRAALKDVQRDMADMRLDYQGLYEKVRVNLSKLAKRADNPPPEKQNGPEPVEDPITQARTLLWQRKLQRR